jgi:DNA helicase II / ATP-dependent DNA helicase PcrA
MTDKEKIQNRLRNIPPEKIKELSDEQADFIVSPLNQSIYLKACPGSGKTEVVGLKSAYEIADWKEKYSGLAILSFTRNAAKEISERISEYNGINSTRYPHYVGTIDSWLHKYLLNPFGHKIINFNGRNGDKSIHPIESGKFLFLSDYQSTLYNKENKPYKIQVNDYYYRFDEKIESNKYDFSSISTYEKEELVTNKDNFLKIGFCTYQDAEYICYKILKLNSNITKLLSKRFPYIFIDECQDLSYSQLYIFHVLHKAGVKLFFIGDLNQAIYEFRKVYTEKIEKFISVNKLIEKELTVNYRSNQKIVNVCCNLEKNINNRKTVYRIEGDNSQEGDFIYIYQYDNIEVLPQIFKEYITEYNRYCNENYEINIKKSAILGRGYSLLSEIRTNLNYELDKVELFANSLICWNISNRTGNDMKNALQQIGKSISNLAYGGKGNYQQQYCPEGVSQLEWRKFLYELIVKASKLIYPFGDKTWSDWTNNPLKIFLKNEWDNLLIKGKKWEEVKNRIRVKSSKKKKIKEEKQKDKKIVDTLSIAPSNFSDEIRIATIHSVKGETLDAVMLVSSETKNSEGGHYEHWISNSPEHNEYIRFAYVASSRPKHLLIWAIPKVKNKKNEIIEKLNNILNLESEKKES